MKKFNVAPLSAAGLFIILGLPCTAPAATLFPEASPESQGVAIGALENLENTVRGFVENDEIVGAELLVVKNGHTVLHRTFGWRDREDSLPMTRNTVFNVRSMTKPLTGAAIQMLIDEGKLALTDRASDYLPGFQNDRSGEITVEQLLTHRSGLPLSILSGFDDYGNLQSMANAIGERGPDFDPGSRLWYSDAGADALGAIVEIVSGTPVDEYLRSRLFEPLGITNTHHLTRTGPEPTGEIASLYGGRAGDWTRFWRYSDEPLYPFPWGSQSVYTTPADYARFLDMLIHGGVVGDRRILSEKAVERILTPVEPMKVMGTDIESPTGFAGLRVYHGQMLIVYVDTAGGGLNPVAFGYGGSDGTIAWAWPKQDLIISCFTQSRGQTTALRFEREIYRNLINPDHKESGCEIPPEYKPFVGSYKAGDGPLANAEFKVLVQNGSLAIDVPGQMVYELNEPDENGVRTFKLTGLVSVSFDGDDSCGVSALTMRQTNMFPRQAQDSCTVGNESSDVAVLSGVYLIPTANQTITVEVEGEELVLTGPDGIPKRLIRSDRQGEWQFSDNEKKKASFDYDENGRVVALLITSAFAIPRLGST